MTKERNIQRFIVNWRKNLKSSTQLMTQDCLAINLIRDLDEKSCPSTVCCPVFLIRRTTKKLHTTAANLRFKFKKKSKQIKSLHSNSRQTGLVNLLRINSRKASYLSCSEYLNFNRANTY